MVQVSCFPILLQPSTSTCNRGIWRVSLQGRSVCAARVERREQHLVARQVSVGNRCDKERGGNDRLLSGAFILRRPQVARMAGEKLLLSFPTPYPPGAHS